MRFVNQFFRRGHQRFAQKGAWLLETVKHKISKRDAPDEPAKEEQEAFLAFFYDEKSRDAPDAGMATKPARLAPTPVTMRPPTRVESFTARSVPDESWPMTMTVLQQLAAMDGKTSGTGGLERKWLNRRHVRQAERVMINAALSVAAVFITGAFAFVRLEGSVSSSREEAERQWLAARQERQAFIAEETEHALAVAEKALTQPKWTDLLSYIKDGRRLLPEIRDHYAEWSYMPFHDPDLRPIKVVENERGLARLFLRLDPATPWASTIVMEKVGGDFKLDWPSFQGRFECEETMNGLQIGSLYNPPRAKDRSGSASSFTVNDEIASLGCMPYFAMAPGEL